MKALVRVLVVACAVLMAACGGDDGDGNGGAAQTGADGPSGSPVVIGAEVPLSGGAAALGESTRQGFDLAVEQINAAGGVLGRPLEVRAEDNEDRPELSVNICRKYVSEGVVMLSSYSFTSIPCAQVTRDRIPQISIYATSHVLTEQGNEWIFRIAVPDTRISADVMQYIADQGYRRASLMHVNNDFGNAAAETLKAEATKKGIDIVSEGTYVNGDRDFSAQLGQVKNANPDVFINYGDYAEDAQIARQMVELGIDVPHIEGDGVASPAYYDLARDAANNVLYGAVWSRYSEVGANVDFVKAFEEKFGNPPDLFAAEGYTAVIVAADAINRAESDDPEDVRDALRETNLTTPIAKIQFDENGDPTYPTYIIQILDGGVERVVQGG